MSVRHSADPAGLPHWRGLVGRERELDRIGALLMGPTRLATLIGSGGIGKTRLAEEAARRLHRARRTPLWCARLARLPARADAAAVRDAVAAAVLVEGFFGASAFDGAVRRLSPLDSAGRVAQTLLIVDNCEHVLQGAAMVIADLLDAVPGLTVLATSREPLGWIDEQLVVVPPLSAKQSLELFRQRAELTGHSISEPGQVAMAKQICAHMHGHPLCIRLAAARMFYEPLPMIVRELSGESGDARMSWRHGPRLGSEGRHRTITDVVAWSYDLCGEKQQLLFDRLSVFAPGYDVSSEDGAPEVADLGAPLEAVEMVCADDVPIQGCEDISGPAYTDHGHRAVWLPRTEIRDLLERLVEKSLVSIHISANTARYFLLESLRLFAAQRLAQRSTTGFDEPARLARRHYCYYRDKVLRPPAEWLGPAEHDMLNCAAQAWSNIRRAIDTSVAAGQADIGLQICVGLLKLRAPFYLGSLPEIGNRLEQTLAATRASQSKLTDLQLAATAMVAWLGFFQGRAQEAEQYLEHCAALCDVTTAGAGTWHDWPDADTALPAVVEFACGAQLLLARSDPRAIAVFARAREKFRSRADPGGEAISGLFEALAAGFYGAPEQAMSITRRHLERTTAAGARWSRSWAQLALAIALTKHGNPGEALQLSRDALSYQMSAGDQWGPIWAVHIYMWSLARLLTDEAASGTTPRTRRVTLATQIAVLAGALRIQRASQGLVHDNMGLISDETRAAQRVARAVLGGETYTDAEERGSRLSFERSEPQRIALGTLSVEALAVGHRSADGGSSSWPALSRAEQEVAILAAAGWSNSAIGVRRGTSTRTVDAQMSSIFEKLMIASRRDITRLVPQDQRRRLVTERARRPRPSDQKPRRLSSQP